MLSSITIFMAPRVLHDANCISVVMNHRVHIRFSMHLINSFKHILIFVIDLFIFSMVFAFRTRCCTVSADCLWWCNYSFYWVSSSPFFPVQLFSTTQCIDVTRQTLILFIHGILVHYPNVLCTVIWLLYIGTDTYKLKFTIVANLMFVLFSFAFM